MRFKGSTIFVTGGGGFIGSAVVRHLLRDTHARVVNIDKLTYAANLDSLPGATENLNYAFEKQCICEGARAAPAVREIPARCGDEPGCREPCRPLDRRPRRVHPDQHRRHLHAVAGNAALLAHALSEKRAQFRFLHISTDEVFGSLGEEGSFTETTAYAPNSPYSASKASSDHLVRAWRETYELPTLVTNCSNNYGPYHFPEKLIPHMIIKGLAGEPLPVYGDGQNIRDWLYVEDHAKALTLVLERGQVGETYNVGGRNERTNLHVVESICDLLDERSPSPNGSRRNLMTFVADRPGHDRRYAIDASKLERDLGWRAEENFETGIRKTVHWYVDEQSWWRAILERGYTAKRVGLSQ